MAAIGSPSAIRTRTAGGSTCPSGPGHRGAGGSKSCVTTTSALDEGFGTGVGSATGGLAGTLAVPGAAAAAVGAIAVAVGAGADAQPAPATARNNRATPCHAARAE